MVDKILYIYFMKYYLIVKKNDILDFCKMIYSLVVRYIEIYFL